MSRFWASNQSDSESEAADSDKSSSDDEGGKKKTVQTSRWAMESDSGK